MHTVTVHLHNMHKGLSPGKVPITALYYRQSVVLQTAGMRTGGTSMTDIRSGYPRRTQGFSVTSLKSSLASGKLPTRRNCLSPVSAISTSKVAGLWRDSLLFYGGSASYTSLWPAQTGHTILISEQSNIYPFWDLQHNRHIHLNTLTNPYYST